MKAEGVAGSGVARLSASVSVNPRLSASVRGKCGGGRLASNMADDGGSFRRSRSFFLECGVSRDGKRRAEIYAGCRCCSAADGIDVVGIRSCATAAGAFQCILDLCHCTLALLIMRRHPPSPPPARHRCGPHVGRVWAARGWGPRGCLPGSRSPPPHLPLCGRRAEAPKQGVPGGRGPLLVLSCIPRLLILASEPLPPPSPSHASTR